MIIFLIYLKKNSHSLLSVFMI